MRPWEGYDSVVKRIPSLSSISGSGNAKIIIKKINSAERKTYEVIGWVPIGLDNVLYKEESWIQRYRSSRTQSRHREGPHEDADRDWGEAGMSPRNHRPSFPVPRRSSRRGKPYISVAQPLNWWL